MSASSAPHDILVKILSQVVDESPTDMYEWKMGFSLLHVCSQWRQAAIPLVHVCAFVADKLPSHGYGTVDFLHPIHSIDGTLRLVQQLKVCPLVKQLHLTYNGELELLVFAKNLLDLLKKCQVEWPQVKTLCLDIPIVNDRFYDDREFAERHRNEIGLMVSLFGSVLPAIKTMYCQNGRNELNVSWFSKLVNSYAHQLVKLHCSSPLLLIAPEFSKELSYLHMCFEYGAATMLPKVYTRSLQYLCLKNVPYNYSWRRFAENDADRDIVFKNLRELKIGYGPQIMQNFDGYMPARTEDEYQIFHFPVLQVLETIGTSSGCYLLSHCKVPCAMKSIHFEGEVDAALYLLDTGLKQVDSLTVISLYPIAHDFAVFDQQLVLLISGVTHSLHLEIADYCTYLNLENFSWPMLTELSTFTVFEGTGLLNLLERMPRLKKATIFDLYINEQEPEFPIPAPDSDERLAPLCPELAWLKFDFDGYLQPCNCLPFTRLLLLRLQGLEYLNIEGVDEDKLNEFIDEYKQIYPHLANLQITWRPSHLTTVHA